VTTETDRLGRQRETRARASVCDKPGAAAPKENSLNIRPRPSQASIYAARDDDEFRKGVLN